MSERPRIAPKDLIRVGASFHTEAVVHRVNDNSEDHVSIIYIDGSNQAIIEDVKWVSDHWEFVISGPNGGYADNKPAYEPFVSLLRHKEGRNRH